MRSSPPRLQLASFGDWLSGLEQCLESAENGHPADSRDAFGGLWRVLELVVHDGQQAGAVLLGFDLPGDAAVRLDGRLRVIQRAPAVLQAPRRIGLDDFAVHPVLRAIRRVAVVRGARLEGRVDVGAVEVLGRELRAGDRLPDLLWGGLDEQLVELGCLRRRSRHPVSSNSNLSSASADTRRSVYLSIQRSWISRIGTAFR